jgi:FKBP-type peptidyl-prolyl cis-trans isomerase 2
MCLPIYFSLQVTYLQIRVVYTCYLDDGTVVASTKQHFDGQAAEFVLGAQQV